MARKFVATLWSASLGKLQYFSFMADNKELASAHLDHVLADYLRTGHKLSVESLKHRPALNPQAMGKLLTRESDLYA